MFDRAVMEHCGVRRHCLDDRGYRCDEQPHAYHACRRCTHIVTAFLSGVETASAVCSRNYTYHLPVPWTTQGDIDGVYSPMLRRPERIGSASCRWMGNAAIG